MGHPLNFWLKFCWGFPNIFIVMLTCFLVRSCKCICFRKGFGSHVFLVAYLVMSGHAIVFLRQEGNPDKDQGMVCMMNVQRLEYKTLEQGRPWKNLTVFWSLPAAVFAITAFCNIGPNPGPALTARMYPAYFAIFTRASSKLLKVGRYMCRISGVAPEDWPAATYCELQELLLGHGEKCFHMA